MAAPVPQASLNVQNKPLKKTRADSASDLEPYRVGWHELADDAPMRSPEWLLAWWEMYATRNDELCILFFHEPGGTLVGLAPLYLRRVGRKATFRILGAGDSVTHHTDWLCAAGWETRIGREVGQFLLKAQPEWKRLLFESVDADAAAIHATLAFLVENGCLGHLRPINSCWKITLPATWDDYLQMLSRSLRKRCRKLQRQFFDSGRIQIRQVESEADLEKGFEILLDLHAARWGSSGKPLGVFDDQRFRAFHEKISRDLLACSKLRLAWLECDGKPIAAEYQFVDAKAVYAYQAGVDLSMDEYSPGKLSMMAAIQFAIARGCESFDLLGGDESYKSSWRAVPADCHDLRVWQNGILGRATWVMWSGYTLAARRLKPIIPARLIQLGLKSLHATRDACGSMVRGR